MLRLLSRRTAAAMLFLDAIHSGVDDHSCIDTAADASASDESPSDQEDVDERPHFADAADEEAYDLLMALPRVCPLNFSNCSSNVLRCCGANAVRISQFALHLRDLCLQTPQITRRVSITYADLLISPQQFIPQRVIWQIWPKVTAGPLHVSCATQSTCDISGFMLSNALCLSTAMVCLGQFAQPKFALENARMQLHHKQTEHNA